MFKHVYVSWKNKYCHEKQQFTYVLTFPELPFWLTTWSDPKIDSTLKRNFVMASVSNISKVCFKSFSVFSYSFTNFWEANMWPQHELTIDSLQTVSHGSVCNIFRKMKQFIWPDKMFYEMLAKTHTILSLWCIWKGKYQNTIQHEQVKVNKLVSIHT